MLPSNATFTEIARTNKAEQEQRARVVEMARTWLGTPYHHCAAIKGVGTDCAMILVAVFQEAGLVHDVAVPAYSPSWHLNRDEEKYTDLATLTAAIDHDAAVARAYFAERIPPRDGAVTATDRI